MVTIKVKEHNWSNNFNEFFLFLFFDHSELWESLLEKFDLLREIIDALLKLQVLLFEKLHFGFGWRDQLIAYFDGVVRCLHFWFDVGFGDVSQLFRDKFLFFTVSILSGFPFDFMQQVESAFLKEFMFKDGNLLLFAYFVEVVHIQLPNKRWKFTMFKILWKNLFGEFLFVFNDKAIPLISPFNDVAIFFILNSN
jgi:hypothetical protein